MLSAILRSATLAAALASTPAAAPVGRAQLEVRAAESCTSRKDLTARVMARSPRIEFVEDGSATSFQVTIAQSHGGAANAELVIVESGAKTWPRRFATRSCAEAADALALMIALALDPVWVAEHGTAIAPNKKPGTSAGSAAPDSEAADRASADLGPTPPEPPKIERALPDDGRSGADREDTPSPPHKARAGVHAAAGSVWGPAPAAMPALTVSGMAALDGEGLWSPAIVLGLSHAWRSDLDQTGGQASFSLDAAVLDACPLRIPVARFETRLCATALLGRMAASGAGSFENSSYARLFAAAGASGLFTLGLGQWVELSARVGIGMALRRDSYQFQSDVFYETSHLTTSASLGAGLRLW